MYLEYIIYSILLYVWLYEIPLSCFLSPDTERPGVRVLMAMQRERGEERPLEERRRMVV